jgi:hypothetical protein
MGDVVSVELTGAWESFADAMDPDLFRQRLEEQLEMANERIGRQFIATAQRWIRADKYDPNSPITVILKGSSKPLVNRGDLFQGITFDQSDPWVLKLGIMRARPKGDDLVNIGLILHEGATVNVGAHPQVRRKVWSMVTEALQKVGKLGQKSRAAAKGAASGLGGQPASNLWVIPARPFLLAPLASAAMQKTIKRTAIQAVKAAFQGGG